MVTFAFSVLGLSEFVTGLLLGVVVGLIIFPALFVLSDWWSSRRIESRAWREEMEYPDESAGSGTLLSDYVDEKTLATIARQKGLEPEPTRRERATSSTRGGDIGGGAHGFRARFRRERRQDEREVFDVEKDPNAVLAALLAHLEREGELDRSVDRAPVLPIDDRTMELVRDIQQGQSLADLRESLIVAEKRRELESIVERAPFVLIESEWTVSVTGPAVAMSLRTLRPRPYGYDRYERGPSDEESQPVVLPEGLSISPVFPTEGLTDPVKSRLREGAVVIAGVLATVLSASEGRLELAPIAVFGRYGSSRIRTLRSGARPYAC